MSFWKVIQGRWGSGAGEVDDIQIDSASNVLEIIEYEHHEIHEGSSFVVRNVVDLAQNAVFDIQITTPNTTRWAHMILSLDVEAETQWWFYENVTINTPGTACSCYNRNRNSATATVLTVKSISNASIADASADTGTATAISLINGIEGAGKKLGGESNSRHEFILKQNATYSLRFLATSAGFVDWFLDWYEHISEH